MSISTNSKQQALLATGAVAVLGVALSGINWPRLIFRGIFGVFAPTKERIWPSDDTSLSPESRGLAWLLLAGPPPPHDIQPIRTMMKYFWPNVWPPIGNDVTIETPPTPRPNSQTLLIGHDRSSTTEGDVALIHIHGGGMVAGTTGTERGFAVELARRAKVPVLSIDYRLVPEALVEEAVQDVVAAYQYFLKKFPQYTKLSFIGGSAGAGHSLLATLKINEMKIEPRPTSLVLSSPAPGMEFLDPEDTNESWKSLKENAPVDGYMAGDFYQYVTGVVYAPTRNRDYFRQQLKDLQGLPPCLVTVGSYEVILDGARKLHRNLQAAKIQVDYKEYQKMQHCHFSFFEFTPESSQAFDELVAWLKASWK